MGMGREMGVGAARRRPRLPLQHLAPRRLVSIMERLSRRLQHMHPQCQRHGIVVGQRIASGGTRHAATDQVSNARGSHQPEEGRATRRGRAAPMLGATPARFRPRRGTAKATAGGEGRSPPRSRNRSRPGHAAWRGATSSIASAQCRTDRHQTDGALSRRNEFSTCAQKNISLLSRRYERDQFKTTTNTI